MRTQVKLLCITPKTGIVRRYLDRKLVDKASVEHGEPDEQFFRDFEYFRCHGLPNQEGVPAA